MSNEYERAPVPQSAQKGAGKFWGMYSGEHAAGTEFMIGPLFLLSGVALKDVFLGLFVGNLLAVLSWRFLCAPIAVKSRITLYYQLEKIAGGKLVKLYNLANGVLFCFLAGAMITVSATAVGIPFNIDMPTIDSVYPNNLAFVVIVLLVGSVIAIVAARGYDLVARFANVASPWMVLVFLGCGMVALKQIGAADWDSLNTVWNASITTAQGGESESTMGFWSIALFAWFCNSAMHIGMADLSVFRYARKASSGWAAAGGMYVGHYMAWIAAAFMLAAQIQATGDTNPVPGPMAANVAGLAGIVCVVVAGWTTANPTIYRAGLAFQAMVPGSSRTTMTLVAGGVATIAGVFPAFAWKLLGFVGFYGTVLAPMGAVIVADWYFAKKAGFQQFAAEKLRSGFNPSVLLAWLIPVSIATYCIKILGVDSWFCVLPCWIATGLLHTLFSKLFYNTP
ncbi:MAG: purine-cytosine permease family protein [Opitutales bacterium]